jgi:hypothetical protein
MATPCEPSIAATRSPTASPPLLQADALHVMNSRMQGESAAADAAHAERRAGPHAVRTKRTGPPLAPFRAVPPHPPGGPSLPSRATFAPHPPSELPSERTGVARQVAGAGSVDGLLQAARDGRIAGIAMLAARTADTRHMAAGGGTREGHEAPRPCEAQARAYAFRCKPGYYGRAVCPPEHLPRMASA